MGDPNNSLLKQELLLARAEAQEMMHEETAFALYKLRRKHNENGGKAGKMLAYQLKNLEQKHTITTLKDSSGSIIRDHDVINDTFRSFFSSLYKSEYKAKQHELEQFYVNLPLSKLNEQEIETLEAPISEVEIHNTVKCLSNGKSPGEDGYTTELYKCFSKEIIPLLLGLHNDVIQKQSMPSTMWTAIISLLPKPGKYHLDVNNYRPLSLLNNDYKLFAKILAKRLEKVVSNLIHLDQVGFIPGRLLSNNMRRLLQIMHMASSPQSPVVAVSLDAERAFDRIEWPYLFHTLSRYGFGPRCLQWIRALYHEPVSSVKSNGLISAPFQLYRSTRQGCPLSPLLFILALEPLACAIRRDIRGILQVF